MNDSRPKCLWADFTVSVKQGELPQVFDDYFTVQPCRSMTSLDAEIAATKPAVLLFDFDYPDKSSLNFLQDTKRRHPSLPIVMMTVQHSEALAVWAFRSRVWDYLVKPVARDDLRRCLQSLHELVAKKSVHEKARELRMPNSPVPEENRLSKGDASGVNLMSAIAYVEKNFGQKISSSQVARHCGLSPFQFSRNFKETYGITFQEFVLRFRIRMACRLLENPNIAVTEVAYLTGFNDPSYFTRIFKRYIGKPPSQYVYGAGSDEVLDPDSLLAVLDGE